MAAKKRSKAAPVPRAERLEETRRLRRAGVTAREIGKLTGVGKSQALRDVAEVDAEIKAGRKPPADVSPVEPDADEGGAEDTLRRMRRLYAKQLQTGENAERDGNSAAAQKAYRDAGALANTMARLEAKTKSAGDAVTLTSKELNDAWSLVCERVAILRGVPLTCSHCGREIRMSAVIDATAGEEKK